MTNPFPTESSIHARERQIEREHERRFQRAHDEYIAGGRMGRIVGGMNCKCGHHFFEHQSFRNKDGHCEQCACKKYEAA
jgi:uncharacterized OB-fold protein